jgi:hypothetical protein
MTAILGVAKPSAANCVHVLASQAPHQTQRWFMTSKSPANHWSPIVVTVAAKSTLSM